MAIDTAAKSPAESNWAAKHTPPCALCGASTRNWMERNGFAIVKCGSCGFGFAVIPNGFDLDAIYRDDAYWTGGLPYGYQPSYDEVIKGAESIFTPRLARMRAHQRPGRLLELGCAGGHFLKLAQEDGWLVEGVEISDLMRRQCAQRIDSRVFASFDEVVAAGGRYNCLVLFEVLEHVTDPLGMLSAMRKVMTPGALLTVSTPNFESYGATTAAPTSVWFEPPAHISYFGPQTLLKCLERAGFKPLELEKRLDHEMPLPRLIAAILRPLRSGKRLRPHGIIGKLIKRYQLRRPQAPYWMDYLVAYARKVD